MILRRTQFVRAVAAVAGARDWVELADAAQRGLQSLGAAAVSIGIVDGLTIRQTVYGFDEELAKEFAVLALSDPLPGPACVASRSVMYFEDRLSTTSAFPSVIPILDRAPYVAAACLPLAGTRDQPLGYLAAHYTGDHRFEPKERLLLEAFAASCAGTASRAYSTGRRVTTNDAAGPLSPHQSSPLTTPGEGIGGRGTVDQATGIVMERFDLTEPLARLILRSYAMKSGIPLDALARMLVEDFPETGLDAHYVTAMLRKR